jgi:hypothetical protein
MLKKLIISKMDTSILIDSEFLNRFKKIKLKMWADER